MHQEVFDAWRQQKGRNMPIFNEIRARRGYSRMSHHEFLLRLRSAYKELFNNPNFPLLPLDLAQFKKKIDEYDAAIRATMTRANLAYVQRNSLRADLEKMMHLLSAYVDHESKNDPAIFATSGLEALPMAHAPQTQLETPRIPKIAHGANSGVLQVWMPPTYRKIQHFKLQYVAVDDNRVPIEESTEIAVTSFKGPVTISNLKPGTLYAFQLRAFGKSGLTDWSDPVYKMCT
jgi:hypothetical protein